MTTKSFAYTGTVQQWTVPENVSSITVTCNGAGNKDAAGGQSVLTVPVSAGRVIYVYVGGAGDGTIGGWNGGGSGTDASGANTGGCGATDIRIGGTALSDRVVVAGGAGGTGGQSDGGAGGGSAGDHAEPYGGGGGTATAGGAGYSGAPAGSLGSGGSGVASASGGGGGGLYGGGAGANTGGGGGSGYVAAVAPDGSTSSGTTTQGAGSSSNGSATIAYTVDFSAPASPTLASPTSGQVLDASSGVKFKATYHSTDGQDCNAYTLRLKTGTGAYSYWQASTSSWSTTEVWNTLTTTVPDGGTIEIDAPASTTIANGSSYSWSVNTQESGADLQGTYADDSSFTASDPPAANITAPEDGSTVSTNLPAAEWIDVLHPSTGVQTKYRVVWESGDYGTEPGSGTSVGDTGEVTGDALTATPESPLPNGVTVRQFVRIWETDGQDSAWAYVTFTVSVTPPSTPALTLTAGSDDATGAPTVTVAVTVADSDAFDHTDTTVQVQASYDGGSTWAPARDAGTNTLATTLALDDDGSASITDAEAVLGAPTLYRANATGTSGDLIVTGAWCGQASITLDVSACWLTDPLDASTALRVPVRSDDTRTRAISQDVTATLGSDEPVISSDVRQKQTGTLTWYTTSKTARDALMTLLDSGRTLLQRAPAEQDDPGMHVYFRPTGDITTDRLAQVPIPSRWVKTGWAERSRP